MSFLTANQVLEEVVAMLDSGDPSNASDVVADAYLDHQGLGAGPMRGVSGFVNVVKASWAAFEHKTVTIEDLFAVDDRAVATPISRRSISRRGLNRQRPNGPCERYPCTVHLHQLPSSNEHCG